MDNNRKILVVDDEAVILDLMNDILEDDGYQVECARNAREALEILATDRGFILLFTDIMMPEMDGIQLIREVRRFAPAIIPIVMTGFATLESARAAVKEGAYDYVLKPFSLSEIKLAVSNAFERHRLTSELARLREVTNLFNISERIAAIRDDRELYDFVLEVALERVDAERGSLMVTTGDGRNLEIAASVGIPREAVHSVAQMEGSISGMVARTGQPLLVSDISRDPSLSGISRHLRDNSFISVPLERKLPPERRNGQSGKTPQVIAVLNVNMKRNGKFTDSDLKVLSIVANHAAAAIENVRLIREVEDAHLATIQSMALLLEAKDAYTHGHSERVRDLALLAATRMGIEGDRLDMLRLGAVLHDIGKVGVSDSILNKPGRPSEDEWDVIRRHPVIGYEVLEPVRILSEEHLHLVRSHHEELDGSGYPDGIRDGQLSELVRIIRVADAFDAMASTRAYREALSPGDIVEELRRHAGSRFDTHVTELFASMIENGIIGHPFIAMPAQSS